VKHTPEKQVQPSSEFERVARTAPSSSAAALAPSAAVDDAVARYGLDPNHLKLAVANQTGVMLIERKRGPESSYRVFTAGPGQPLQELTGAQVEMTKSLEFNVSKDGQAIYRTQAPKVIEGLMGKTEEPQAPLFNGAAASEVAGVETMSTQREVFKPLTDFLADQR
jgi:hypothetical protein